MSPPEQKPRPAGHDDRPGPRVAVGVRQETEILLLELARPRVEPRWAVERQDTDAVTLLGENDGLVFETVAHTAASSVRLIVG